MGVHFGVASWLATAPVLPNSCRLRSAQDGDDSKFIHGPFHIGDRQQVLYLRREEAQKGKIGGRGYIGVYIAEKMHVCMYQYIASILG